MLFVFVVQEKTLQELVKEVMLRDKLLMFHLLEELTKPFTSLLNMLEIKLLKKLLILLKPLLMNLLKLLKKILIVVLLRKKKKLKEMPKLIVN